jgi:hypothetical protein
METEDVTEVEKVPLLQKIRGVLNEVHPNRWEIVKYTNLYEIKDLIPYQRNVLKSKSFSIIIHYPEIIITNSKEYKHKIKDLFIVLIFKNGILNDIKGFRTTFTSAEYISNYVHSHLPIYGINQVNSFCVGSSEFYSIVKKFKQNEVTELTFKYLLFSIDSFLKWESLEGGPYIKIQDILYVAPKNIIDLNDISFGFLTEDVRKKIVENSEIVIKKTLYQTIYEVKITKFKELLEILPNEYKTITIQDEKYVKRSLPTHEESIKNYRIYTNKFDKKIKVLNSNILPDIENIVFDNEVGSEFIEKLEKELTIKINKLI